LTLASGSGRELIPKLSSKDKEPATDFLGKNKAPVPGFAKGTGAGFS
jgi:hypothetical protein